MGGTAQCLLRTARLFGLAPYVGEGSYRASLPWRVYSVGMQVLMIAFQSVSDARISLLSSQMGLVSDVALRIRSLLSLCTSVALCVTCAFRQHHQLLHIINLPLMVSLPWPKCGRWSWTLPVVIFLPILAKTASVMYIGYAMADPEVSVNFNMGTSKPILRFGTEFYFFAVALEFTLFSYLLMCVSERYAELNRSLSLAVALPGLPGHPDPECSAAAAAEQVKQVASARLQHQQATDMLTAICKCFAPALTMALLLHFFMIVGCSFAVLGMASSSIKMVPVLYSAFLVRMLEQVAVVLPAFAVASRTAETGMYSTVELHLLLNSGKMSNAGQTEVFLFLMQISTRPVHVSFLGIFCLDWKLLFTASGALVTYLVIFMQFQSACPPCQCNLSAPQTTTAALP